MSLSQLLKDALIEFDNLPKEKQDDFIESLLTLKEQRQCLIQDEIQSRIFRGELEVTDADGVDTMLNHQ